MTGGERADTLHHTVTSRYLPAAVTVPVSEAHVDALGAVAPWIAPYAARVAEVAAFVCRDFVCAAPVKAPESLAILLDDTVQPGPVENPGTIQ